MRLSVRQYAIIRKKSPQGVTKKIRTNVENGWPMHTGLADIQEVEKVGNSYILITAQSKRK